MTVTTDPLAALIARLDSLDARVKKLETTTPAPPPPQDDAQKFLERWAPVTPEQFIAKYGVEWGQQIPPMVAYDEAEVIYRARAFYGATGYRGGRWSHPQPAWDAISVIAHSTNETATTLYECGRDLALSCYPDALAAAFLYGTVKTQQEFQQGLGTGTQPRDLAGVDLQHLTAGSFGGGQPSGG